MFSIEIARRRTIAAAVVSLTLFSACGGSDASSVTTTSTTVAPEATDVPVETAAVVETDTPAELPTYTIVAGDTISGIATRSGVSIDALVQANDWPDGADHLIVPGDVINVPAGVTVAASSGSATTLAPGSSTTPAETTAYTPTDSVLRISGSRTDPIASPLADGLYFSENISSNGTDVTIKLGQFIICDGAQTDLPDLECVNGFGTLNTPSTTVKLATNAKVTVAGPSMDEPAYFIVSPAEFARLVSGKPPAASAPAGYEFVNWFTWVRVSGGVAVDVQQFYTS